jgi:hypothetical protein
MKRKGVSLKLKKEKIVCLNTSHSIKGGTNTINECNTQNTGTDNDSRKICPTNTQNDPVRIITQITCVNICPSIVVTFGC